MAVQIEMQRLLQIIGAQQVEISFLREALQNMTPPPQNAAPITPQEADLMAAVEGEQGGEGG